MKLIIKNGRVIDPANNIDGEHDIVIDKGVIQSVTPAGKSSAKEDGSAKIIDAKGCVVAPGFMDMHVHFREPGFEYKETIESGCESADAGGFTTVAMMPNTNPVNDNRSVTELMISQAKAHGKIQALAIGAITKGLKAKPYPTWGI